MRKADIAILGAGPAGMAAAQEAAQYGLSVFLIDEQHNAGGQIYRDVDRVAPLRGKILGQDYLDGLPLTQGINHKNITHFSGATVWQVEADGHITFSRDDQAETVKAERILLATGALERPMPVPGWTLPGVMTVGAGQILLKQSGLLPDKAVLVGSGPLLYVLAGQMVAAGMPPLALVETQTAKDFARSLRHFDGALRGWFYLLKGLKLMATLSKARIKRYRGAHTLRLEGDDSLQAIRFDCGGKSHRIDCNTAMLHHGVVPNIQISQCLELDHDWDKQQLCFTPRLDDWGQSSSRTVFIAGDGAGIGGAKVAEISGRLAALQLSYQLGKISAAERDRYAAPLHKAKAKQMAARPFLDTAYPPCPDALAPQDETIICRCEEVTAGDIRQYAALGCPGPNQVKAFGRSGMGLCQGRNCGLSVSMLLAKHTGKSMDEVGYFKLRAPLKPVQLGELASLAITNPKE